MGFIRLLPVWLLACTAPDDNESGQDTEDTAVDTDTGQNDELFGSPPDTPLAAPEFAATNRDGTSRSREDLMGHATVFWFFPAAGTYG